MYSSYLKGINLGKISVVRFLDVRQPKALEEKLDSIWLGSFKLRVNIPFFGREASGSTMRRQQPINGAINRPNGLTEGISNAKVVVDGGLNGLH